ncbi:ABC transporter permease [Mucilaginibacter myungsuensis]|uniref:ABC transporter permease n=1 Tax=Mucilaginibacter myungsuensis TaxID=649104 RepID=A0A929PUE0_9SPHI|nr:FtsX-like permease family protein [Mucilaginibacter myungsuensis]MBE9660648.1 ABC transporter permease [Mucilaginibacter myungsuensis]MDN3600693.1 ABC transporter permease [Mucilaginibacter myungsuensis]
MFRNYFKIAMRSLWRDRTFSFINLLGLAVGLASVLMILAYVRFELSYDKSYSNSPNVYRLTMQTKENGEDETRLDLPSGLADVYKKEFPAVTAYSSVSNGKLKIKHKGEMVELDQISASPDFFKLFNFTFLQGAPEKALAERHNVVITQSTAEKYFPGVPNVVGKSIYSIQGKRDLLISGVIADIPANTHFKADVIYSWSLNEPLNWRAYSSVSQYILLNNKATASVVQEQFKSIYKKYGFPPEVEIALQPVTSIHLYSHTEDEMMPNGDIKYIYIFSSIALLILFVACINYINLTTARSIQRAREIGVRKVLGAVKRQLIMQFLSESFLFFVVCSLLGAILAKAAFPMLSGLIGPAAKEVSLFDGWSALAMLFIILLFGFLSGLYPSFILSKIKTASVIKGTVKLGVNVSLRKVLVAVQFVITGVLIVCTLVIYQQLRFVNNTRLGFDKDNLIAVPFYMMDSHVATFKNELKQHEGIKGITVASWETGVHFGAWATMNNETDTTKTWKFQFVDADPDFIKTMGIKVQQGRDFSRSIQSDVLNIDSLFDKARAAGKADHSAFMVRRPIILNEEALAMMGIKYQDNLQIKKGALHGTVIGKVQNFNGLNLHEKIPAVVIRCSANKEFGQMYIRISPQNTQQTLAFIQKKWSQFYPEQNFDFKFVDDKLQQLYSADKKVGEMFGTFAVLAIVIACLGLFGLISLTVQNRVKEIGIRKVLGASVANITALLSVEFLQLVIISMVIASPIAWYMMDRWLQDFAYHIQINWWIFALAAGISLLIAFVTLSFRSVKAAMANPVNSLRSE